MIEIKCGKIEVVWNEDVKEMVIKRDARTWELYELLDNLDEMKNYLTGYLRGYELAYEVYRNDNNQIKKEVEGS